jgi:hypothetical protein
VHLRGHRKKLREGARAEAVVTDRKGASLTTHGYSAIDLVLEGQIAAPPEHAPRVPLRAWASNSPS